MGNYRNVIVFVLYFCLSLVNAQNFNNYNQCVTPDNRRGSCIELRQCNSLFNLLQKVPLTNNDRFYLSRSQCGYYNNSPWVCCPPETQRPNPPPNPQPNPQPTPVGQTFNINDLPQPGKCGTELSDRIIGGKETRVSEFPWMALIQYTKPNNAKGFHCGGVLINENYVLTASHCVNGKDLTQLKWQLTAVRLGEWDTASDQDCEEDLCSDPVLDIPVAEKIPHEEYQPNSRSQENDIALLRLSRTVRFTDWVKPVCLPVAPHLRGKNFDGAPLDVAGWGKTEAASNSNVKLKVELNGVPLNQCNNVYRAQNVVLGSKQLCAGGVQGFDSCRGDSGGPLTAHDSSIRNNPYYYLVGVVSFGPSPCGLAGWPGVYTRVDSYIDWMLSKMRP